jgi:hypothetical protein
MTYGYADNAASSQTLLGLCAVVSVVVSVVVVVRVVISAP